MMIFYSLNRMTKDMFFMEQRTMESC